MTKKGFQTTVRHECAAFGDIVKRVMKERCGRRFLAKACRAYAGESCPEKSSGAAGAALAGGEACFLEAEDRAALVGGARAAVIGKELSALSGGESSFLVGDHYSAVVGGRGAVLFGGYASALSCSGMGTLCAESASALVAGADSKLSGGKCSVLYGGPHTLARGGMWSVLAFQVWKDNTIVAVKTAVVDGVSILPDVWYTLKDDAIVEALNK